MAKLIREIMNHEVLSVGAEEEVEAVLVKLMAHRVSGAPVLNAAGELVGVVSWRDLVFADGPVSSFMSSPVLSVNETDRIDAAALTMAESGRHRLIVLDGGRVVGVVSTQDVLRALVGIPVQHPETFPHFDSETRLVWSDDRAFEAPELASVTQAEGLIALVQGRAAVAERIVWVEACENIQRHLTALLEGPERRIPHLTGALTEGSLRFRFAKAPDISRRMKGLRTLLQRAKDERRERFAEQSREVNAE